MDALKEHTVEFAGLKDGLHDLHFTLDDAFFAAAADEELHGGSCAVAVKLDKNPNLLVADLHLVGSVRLDCDHCNAPLDHPVDGRLRQVYHLNGRQRFDGDDDVIGLDPDDHAIQLTHPMYECLRLALPARRVHPPGGCDPAVDAILDHQRGTPAGNDPRWSALNALKDKR
ncbi:MAG: DUF177 domain-containing protein [Flavobacteriales bacterium]|nr:hypothetical protein [Flavobacteriales bacterium]MCC6576142.1 DUF177 domain-containing protein [Flavobacteriales bacterium]NUQ14860.1 DUF177 domain-containing protein [Flavobacteriales bacterium]